MKLKIKVRDAYNFDRMCDSVGRILFTSKPHGKSYTTDNGAYEVLSDGIIIFDGKRGSFGKSKYLKITRKQRRFRKDQVLITLGGKSFEIDILVLETSAEYKPFWATCSDKEYAQLKTLKAR